MERADSPFVPAPHHVAVELRKWALDQSLRFLCGATSETSDVMTTAALFENYVLKGAPEQTVAASDGAEAAIVAELIERLRRAVSDAEVHIHTGFPSSALRNIAFLSQCIEGLSVLLFPPKNAPGDTLTEEDAP